MRGCVGWVVRVAACGIAMGCPSIGPAFAQGQGQAKPQPQTQAQPQPAKPAAGPKPFDVCKGLTGANAAQKVVACTEAIKEGKLTAGDLASAYLNRGLSETGEGSDQRAKVDYRAAIRIFNDLILGSPLNATYYMQRGVIYQTCLLYTSDAADE